MENNYIPLPSTFDERVAIDRLTKIVYVDQRCIGDPLLLTWVERNKASGIEFKLEKADMADIAKLRARGMRDTEEMDIDMVVRGQAMDIIRKAASYRASDIHLMMRGEHTDIQIVVKGQLRALASMTHEEGDALARAIYQGIAKTRDSSFNALEFQNAQIPGDVMPPDTNLTSIRIIRGPCYPQAHNGSFMTMRLQYGTAKPNFKQESLPSLPLPRSPEGSFQLGRMGYTAKQLDKIQRLMDAPNGIIIVTGPTGSGKTTSMYEALKETARKKAQRRLVTIEDPVEYPMDWAVQLSVTDTRTGAETGIAVGERLRAALRMAPNIILLSELRDSEVAVSALEAAVTGHQVWTTMHVTDPFLFVERLELMDSKRLHRRAFCDHKIVRGVIAQRLLPKLCPKCSEPFHKHPSALSMRIVKALQTWGDIAHVRVQGPGCDVCAGDGTVDRFAVAEVVVMNAAVMSDFINQGSEKARDNYRASPDADPSMLESAISLALKGLLDPRAIEDCIDLIEPKDGAIANPVLVPLHPERAARTS
ncbi:MAG TPA: ATPase, T2SS/T4P/T4SS family [Noviherbaspirillum sp.]|nr:ATPase, T2SS/T4P/T4SS family [Noviherbaspirillum sp.]